MPNCRGARTASRIEIKSLKSFSPDLLFHQSQKRYFSANCMILGSFAVVTFPKRLLFRSVVGLFMLKLSVTLKASARNSTRFISRIWNVLESERSNCHELGPLMLPLPHSRTCPKPD